MKRYSLYFLTTLFAFGLGVLVSQIKLHTFSRTPTVEPPSLEVPCRENAVIINSGPNETAQLRLIRADCSDFRLTATLSLTNLGPKSIRGYEVGTIQDYEYKKEVQSSQSVVASEGVLLAPGATTGLSFNGSFRRGLSYGKPTGSLLKSFFWIKHLEYSDGTSWSHSSLITK